MAQDTPKRAVIYARISQDRTGAGLGVDKQEQDCRQLAERLGLEVVGVRRDNDITAFKGRGHAKVRDGYNDLLDDIRGGRADAVIAWHTDRLHRDMTELDEYIRVCGEGADGVPTYTVRGGDLDLSNASGRMIAKILGAVAQQEVEHMIERQKNAKERIRSAGGWQGGSRPFGYRREGPTLKEGGDGGMVQVPAEAAAIAEAYEQVLRDGPDVELGETARRWNSLSLLSPRETARGSFNSWHSTNVKRALLAARNAGLITYKGEVVAKGKWDPIVSEDVWRAAVAILTERTRRGRVVKTSDGKKRAVVESPGPAPKYLLAGSLMTCAVCEQSRFSSVTQVSTTRGRYRVYMCRAFHYVPDDKLPPGMKRHHLARGADTLDRHIESIVRMRLGDPDVIAAFNATPEVDAAALDTRRQEVNAELDEIAASPFPVRQKTAMAGPLLIELGEIERQISVALRGNPMPEFVGQDPVAVYDAMTVERKRAVIRAMMRIRLHRPGRHGNQFDYDSVEILPPGA